VEKVRLDKDKILEYLKFLVHYSEELHSKELVSQEDLIYLNNEVDKLLERLSEQGISWILSNKLQRLKIDCSQFSETSPRNLSYYIASFFLLGCLSTIFVARGKKQADSAAMKVLLEKFRHEMIATCSVFEKQGIT